jgi:predicted short-subunit dehydrogenase-like oxidoreductase (DUF2520 family)
VVGTALAHLLDKCGYVITGISTRTLQSAESAAKNVPTKRFTDCPWEISRDAQVVFITTPDDAIESTCQAIAENQGFNKGAVVVHCSGALSSGILSSARNCKARVASLHPLQSFASVAQAVKILPGSYCAVEGDKPALAMVRQLVVDLGGFCLEIGTDGKTLYHAAAVVASNYLVTLLDVALALNNVAGMSREVSFKALLPLVEGTLKNIETKGIPQALTGPVARGDLGTVRAHLKAIGDSSSELVAMYKILGCHAVSLAKAKGTLGAETAKELLSLFQCEEFIHVD